MSLWRGHDVDDDPGARRLNRLDVRSALFNKVGQISPIGVDGPPDEVCRRTWLTCWTVPISNGEMPALRRMSRTDGREVRVRIRSAVASASVAVTVALVSTCASICTLRVPRRP